MAEREEAKSLNPLTRIHCLPTLSQLGELKSFAEEVSIP